MRNIHRIALTLLFAVAAAGCAARKDAFKPTRPYVEGEIIVQFKDGPESIEAKEANAKMGATVLKSLDKLKIALVQLPPTMDTVKAVETYRTLPGVVTAEPNYVVSNVHAPAQLPPAKAPAPAVVKKAPAKKTSKTAAKKKAAPAKAAAKKAVPKTAPAVKK